MDTHGLQPSSDDTSVTTDATTGEPPRVRPVDLRDYVSFSEESATRVRVFATDRLAMDIWCIEPRQATPVLHFELQAVTYTIVAGRSWFITDDGEVGLDPLGSILIGPGTVHGIDNRGADPLIVIAQSSPPSDEPENQPIQTSQTAILRDPQGPNPVRRIIERILGTERPDGRLDGPSGRPDEGRTSS